MPQLSTHYIPGESMKWRKNVIAPNSNGLRSAALVIQRLSGGIHADFLSLNNWLTAHAVRAVGGKPVLKRERFDQEASKGAM